MFSMPFFVVLPLFGAFLITFLNSVVSNKKIRYFLNDFFAVLFTGVLFALSFFTIGKKGVYYIGGWVPPFGINFVLDGLSSLMLVVINLISFCATVFSIDYMKQYTAKRYYYALFLLMVAGMNGVVLTGDFFNLFVFIEIASISSYALVAFGTEAEELEASFKYMVMGCLATVFILFGIAILYSKFGILNMILISKELTGGVDPLTKFAFFLLVIGFFIKAAVVPFHAWLPDAHPSAPAPVSAMLSGVLIKSLGVYALVRISFSVFSFEASLPLAYLGIISMIVGVLLALGQMDIKRLLAYHSISQIGYILLGLGIGTPLGIIGGLFHLINHSIFKSLLFLNSGAIFYRTKTRNLEEMGGLHNVMPVTGTTSLAASLSISGLPPFNGFFSKLIIILACVEAQHYVFAIWAIVGSILTLASFTKVQKFAFYGENKNWRNIKEVPFFMCFAMVFLALLCLLTSLLLLPYFKEAFLLPAQKALDIGEYIGLLK